MENSEGRAPQRACCSAYSAPEMNSGAPQLREDGIDIAAIIATDSVKA
jgi:hypothetical protein